MAKIFKDKCGSWYGSDVYLTLSQQQFNGKSAINYFKNISSYGWSNNSICAILGNMCFESSLNPQLQQRGGSGYGLVQWTPKSNLTSRAKAIKQGSTYDTMFTQLSVIDYEVKNKKQWIKTTRYPLTFEEFVTDITHDILYLTGAWLCNYERPADQSDSNISKRCNGDSSHMGSIAFSEMVGGDVSPDGNINGFLEWCEKIANDNKYLFEGQEIAAADLEYTVSAHVKDYPDGLLIQVDDNADHGTVVKLMDSARNVGVTSISLSR